MKICEKGNIFDIVLGVMTKLGIAETFKSMEKMLRDMDNAVQITKWQ